MGVGARDTSTKSFVRPAPTWLVECCEQNRPSSWTCTLTAVPQATGICAVCGQSIFKDHETGRDHRI